METIEIGAWIAEETLVSPGVFMMRKFDTFVKPVVNPLLTSYCTKLTHIKQIDVARAPLFGEAIARFREFVDPSVPYRLISWGAYDKKQLLTDCRLAGVKDTDWIADKHVNLKWEYQKLFRGGRAMRVAMNKLGVSQQGTAHRGIDDAWNLMRVFSRMYSMPKVRERICS